MRTGPSPQFGHRRARPRAMTVMKGVSGLPGATRFVSKGISGILSGNAFLVPPFIAAAKPSFRRGLSDAG